MSKAKTTAASSKSENEVSLVAMPAYTATDVQANAHELVMELRGRPRRSRAPRVPAAQEPYGEGSRHSWFRDKSIVAAVEQRVYDASQDPNANVHFTGAEDPDRMPPAGAEPGELSVGACRKRLQQAAEQRALVDTMAY